MNKNILPIILIIIDLSQSIVCLVGKDYPRVLYWLAAGLITFSTIIMKG